MEVAIGIQFNSFEHVIMGKEFSNIIPAISDDVSFTDTVFGFWEDFQDSPENSSHSGNDEELNVNDQDEDDSLCTVEKNDAFWEEQEQLLKESSREAKVRQATKEALTELNTSEMLCMCRRSVMVTSCRDCLMREICDRLLNLGYNSAVCKSKWNKSSQNPSGEHTYLEVITDNSSNAKRGVLKVIIELNFRAEFEMARANEEYNQFVRRLPEVFIGKAERLRVIVKIMCSAAKKCTKEKKMHLGPWRKHKYMQAKWVGTCDNRSLMESLPTLYSTTRRSPKPKASMLTCDLLENISGYHCTAVEVV